jgi:hypothetical protein
VRAPRLHNDASLVALVCYLLGNNAATQYSMYRETILYSVMLCSREGAWHHATRIQVSLLS